MANAGEATLVNGVCGEDVQQQLHEVVQRRMDVGELHSARLPSQVLYMCTCIVASCTTTFLII